jgi:hypothetical protein
MDCAHLSRYFGACIEPAPVQQQFVFGLLSAYSASQAARASQRTQRVLCHGLLRCCPLTLYATCAITGAATATTARAERTNVAHESTR